MPNVRMLARYARALSTKETKFIEKELETQEIIKGDKFNADTEREKVIKQNKISPYEYGGMGFDLKDVARWNYVDDKHTCIEFYGGRTVVFKINMQEFEIILQSLLSIIVNDFTEDKTEEKNEQSQPDKND